MAQLIICSRLDVLLVCNNLVNLCKALVNVSLMLLLKYEVANDVVKTKEVPICVLCASNYTCSLPELADSSLHKKIGKVTREI